MSVLASYSSPLRRSFCQTANRSIPFRIPHLCCLRHTDQPSSSLSPAETTHSLTPANILMPTIRVVTVDKQDTTVTLEPVFASCGSTTTGCASSSSVPFDAIGNQSCKASATGRSMMKAAPAMKKVLLMLISPINAPATSGPIV